VRKVDIRVGNVFRIPLLDDSSGGGQVLVDLRAEIGAIGIALIDRRFDSSAAPEDRDDNVIAAMLATPELLERAQWPVVASAPACIEIERIVPVAAWRRNDWVGARIVGAGLAAHFMNAVFGLRPWDDWADEGYFDSLLAPGVGRPAGVVLTRR
jgi:hypothetical protein